MSAVEQNTWRGFHKIDKNSPGAKEAFVGYFIEERERLVSTLSTVCSQADLHELNNRICDGVRTRMNNINHAQLASYNKVRKPVDLYVEHLVAMARELDKIRDKLVPLLFLPLDSWILGHPALFTEGELTAHGVSRRSTYSAITVESTYVALQALLEQKANTTALQQGHAFHRIYFDLLWNHRYRNQGGTLFGINP